MKITFTVNYRTNWGESIYIYGTVPQLGGGSEHNAVEMEMADANTWRLTVEVPDTTERFTYRYVVKAENRPWHFEWGESHVWTHPRGATRSVQMDSWSETPSDKPFYSSAFTKGIFARRDPSPLPDAGADSLTLTIEAPQVEPEEDLYISGEPKALGAWQPEEAHRLSDSGFPAWTVTLPLQGMPPTIEYKFFIKNRRTGQITWENCSNRILTLPAGITSGVAVSVGRLRLANPKWPWKGAGTAIPVFSLRSETDFGVGDFGDLRMMIDWCAETGQKLLQLLPVNDTTMTGTWTDSYPYNANSTFALHPMYVSLPDVGELSDKKRMAHYEDLRRELNALPQIDYERATKAKADYMREIFAEQGAATRTSETYRKFVEDNLHWLRPYAAFCVLRDLNGTPDMTRWGDYAVYEESAVKRLCAEHADDIDFVYFVQYHLDRQLRAARDYAHSRGVVLKGDIPIGISRTSVDAWQYPRLFNMDSQAGAPPDDFSVLGQNWGFPTYNWDEMARDGFAWWKARFGKMAQYFDAYRIDHILGFFRIWQIPLDAVHGLLGVFNPALPFSADEMRSHFDFHIDVDLQTNPLIMDWMLGDFFGPYAEEARERFLEHMVNGRYRLQPYVDTQRKVADYFATQPKDEKNHRLCEALLGLIDDVLFIEDPVRQGHYHPRIAAQFTYQYRRLDDYQKSRFDTLYNDFYYRRNNDFWQDKAFWKLPPLIDSTSMLTCAEDLGMIPDCVPYVMHSLQILSLEIQRMPKNPREEFGVCAHYPYYSVCTTSTHDMPGIRGWWEQDHAAAQHYYNNVLGQQGDAPYFAEPWICTAIDNINLEAPSMLCVLPLQDWLATDGTLRRENPVEEQINIPAISRHYWRYRMHLTIENLRGQTAFNDSIRAMITRSGRMM